MMNTSLRIVAVSAYFQQAQETVIVPRRRIKSKIITFRSQTIEKKILLHFLHKHILRKVNPLSLILKGHAKVQVTSY